MRHFIVVDESSRRELNELKSCRQKMHFVSKLPLNGEMFSNTTSHRNWNRNSTHVNFSHDRIVQLFWESDKDWKFYICSKLTFLSLWSNSCIGNLIQDLYLNNNLSHWFFFLFMLSKRIHFQRQFWQYLKRPICKQQIVNSLILVISLPRTIKVIKAQINVTGTVNHI